MILDADECLPVPHDASIVTQSQGHNIMPNIHRRRRRDATVKLSRVGGVYWALSIDDVFSDIFGNRRNYERVNVDRS